VELTLNLLHGSRLNPNIFAWAQLHGPFDFNWTPIALPGMHILIREKASVRGTWAPHAVDGWYLGPALRSYWCYTIWSKDAHVQCICNTLTWIPSTVPVPTATTADYILASIMDIANALQKPPPNSPLEPLTESQVMALEQLMVVLHGKKKGNCNTAPDVAPATIAPTLRVGPPASIQHQHELPAAALRVDPNPAPQQPPLPSDQHHPANHIQMDHNALSPPPTVKDSSSHDDPTVITSNCAAQPSWMVTTQWQTGSMHCPQHSPCHVAATATIQDPTVALEHALHSNAFNPDTGKLAEYSKLSCSSDGAMWQASNATEIHHLAQGHSKTTGTSFMCYPGFGHPMQQESYLSAHCVCTLPRKGSTPLCPMDHG